LEYRYTWLAHKFACLVYEAYHDHNTEAALNLSA